MPYFTDTVTGRVFAVSPAVKVTHTANGYTFSLFGETLPWPTTYVPFVPPAAPQPTPEQQLANAKQQQMASVRGAYAAANAVDIAFTTAAGVAQTYQADPESLGNLTDTLLGFQKAGATPSGFYWVAADNTQVPFTYADLQGLAEALTIRGNTNFQKYQTLKAQIRAATTVSAVQAATW